MNDLDALTPFTQNTSLANFLPVPRYLFAMRLSSTALLLYILLLDRASLSKQNGWHNRDGWVYLRYPVADLARVLGKNRATVQKLLRELEGRGLVIRSHPTPGGATHYFLRVPASSAVAGEEPPFFSGAEKITPAAELEEGWLKFQWDRSQKSAPNKQRE